MKYFNVFDHPKFYLETKENGVDSIMNPNKKQLYGTKQNKNGFLVFSVEIFQQIWPSRIMLETERIHIEFWDKIRYNCMEQENV